jgi:ribonucleoside-diphosphate reductase alpha chain
MALKKTQPGEAQAEPAEPVQAFGQPVKAPAILSAVRIRQKTPFGHMHVSITVDPKTERELEVFGLLGKAGNVAMSDLEAVCRMVSLFLRAGGSIKDVIDQLEGIGSSLTVGTQNGRVMSLGDALGKTIKRYWEAKKKYGLRAILLGDVDLEQALNGGGNGNGGEPQKSGTTVILGKAKAQSADERLLEQYGVRCPECGSGTLTFEEGCKKCVACGYSEC